MVIAGGGSGGHLFPGIAVADEFTGRGPNAEVVFIGTETGIEASVIPKKGYSIRYVKAEGYLGKSLLQKAVSLLRMLGSVKDAKAMLKEIEPDVVVGTGGYVSVGPVLAARLLHVPTLILEQNLVPGLANRMLAKVADAVAVTYHESIGSFPKGRTYLTGNPVRTSILEDNREAALEKLSLETDRVTLLVLGGSKGARSINNAVTNALNHMLDIREEVQFLHQTGQEDYESARKAYRKLDFKAMVVPFIHEMADAFAAADLVISRAGATTLAEITALGKPSILIPYPHAAGHQEFNAKKLSEIGACVLLPERTLSDELLAGKIKELVDSEDRRTEMAKQSRALGRPDAAGKAVDIAMSLLKAGKN